LTGEIMVASSQRNHDLANGAIVDGSSHSAALRWDGRLLIFIGSARHVDRTACGLVGINVATHTL
jgi:hypothetical protein